MRFDAGTNASRAIRLLLLPRDTGSRPDEWKLPSRAAWCLYARWWIDVKRVWRLAVTVAEKGAPDAMLAMC
jgi:hypothetical protein